MASTAAMLLLVFDGQLNSFTKQRFQGGNAESN
jgi:hypothetical protein